MKKYTIEDLKKEYIAVKTPTQEIFNKVMKFLGLEKRLDSHSWNTYRENTCIGFKSASIGNNIDGYFGRYDDAHKIDASEIEGYEVVETLQEKKVRLEKELALLNKQLEINVGDIVRRTNSSHGGMEVGDLGTVVEIYGVGNNANIYIKEYGGKDLCHSGRCLEKVLPEEAETYKKSKQKQIVTLSSGFKIIVTKEGFMDEDGYKYDPLKLRQLINPPGFTFKSITTIDATYQIGCQKITLEEIKKGLEIYDKIVAE